MEGCYKIDHLLGIDVYRMGLSAAEVVERKADRGVHGDVEVVLAVLTA